MNAQEAIEILQPQIDELDKRLAFNRDKYEGTRSKELKKVLIEIISEVSKEREALSIILESAKYLHEEILEPSRQEEWRGKADKRLSILYDIPEGRIEIMDEDLGKIGIEEGANQ